MGDVYVDFTKSTGTLTGTWTFTNASTSVTAASDGDAVNELANGDYIRQSDGTQWYKVTARPDADTITITPAFQQATHTDDVGASLYNSENGSATGQAFAHLYQATSDNVRTAGDTITVRANQTHVYKGLVIAVDEDGIANNYITLLGASVADDPWGDASDVRAIISFGESFYYLSFFSDNYWKIKRLDFVDGTSGQGVLNINFSEGIIVEDCRFYNNGDGAADVALYASTVGGLLVKDCMFDNNFGTHLGSFGSSEVRIEGCIFDGDTVGGGNGTDTGVSCRGHVYLKNCIFAGTDGHDSQDLLINSGGYIYMRNTKLNSVTEVNLTDLETYIYSEDDEQTHLAFRSWQFPGNTSRSAVVERSGSGGTAWSILGEPGANCGADQALYLMGDWLRGVPIYLDGTEQTITVYAYATSWAGLPSVSQFVVEVEHTEGAGDWDIDVTADTFAGNDQWESFAITLTPDAAGPAYLRVKLLDYEDGSEKIYVDPAPEFS